MITLKTDSRGMSTKYTLDNCGKTAETIDPTEAMLVMLIEIHKELEAIREAMAPKFILIQGPVTAGSIKEIEAFLEEYGAAPKTIADELSVPTKAQVDEAVQRYMERHHEIENMDCGKSADES